MCIGKLSLKTHKQVNIFFVRCFGFVKKLFFEKWVYGAILTLFKPKIQNKPKNSLFKTSSAARTATSRLVFFNFYLLATGTAGFYRNRDHSFTLTGGLAYSW